MKICFSVTRLMIYRAVIKSSPGPSVFRGKTTNYLFKFFTDTSFNSDKHYQLPALLAWRRAHPNDPRGRDPVPGQHPGWRRPRLRGILLHRQVANIYFSHNKLEAKKQGFEPKINILRRKPWYFVNSIGDSPSKIRHDVRKYCFPKIEVIKK